jgi:hypothetical protein
MATKPASRTKKSPPAAVLAAPIAVAAATASRVAVVGAGLAGLTTALKLSKAGFAVTLFEKNTTLGGNISSQRSGEIYHDVYPHMFCDWYKNFWDLFENDLGIPREQAFSPRDGVKILKKGSTEYFDLRSGTSLPNAIANLRSGLLSPPEIFLLGFSMLDLVAHPFNHLGLYQLDMLDVNGFIYSRGYATEPVARLQNYILMLIWSIRRSQTAAASYQDFIKHSFTYPDGAPFAWMLKGSLAETIVAPLEAKLRAQGCTVVEGAEVTSIRIVNGKPELRIGQTHQDFDHVVIAVRPEALYPLVMGEQAAPGTRIVEKVPNLAQLYQLWAAPIPVVDLYLNIKLPNFPKEHIGLAESRYDLTVLDFSQLWENQAFHNRTALVIAASDAAALPTLDPKERGQMIIAELHAFLPLFRPGQFWGDPDSDIDWSRTSYRDNTDYPLFINDIGSWEWRPRAAYPDVLPRIYFAGDFCQTDVDMATMEAATQSAILAARAVQAQDAALTGKMRGAPVAMAAHQLYSTTTFRAAKLALLPYAYLAVAWAAYNQDKRLAKADAEPLGANQYRLSEYALVLPLQFSLDWLKSAYWLARSLSSNQKTAGVRPEVMDGDTFTGDKPQDAATAASKDDDDIEIGLAQATLSVVADLFDTLAESLPARGETLSATAGTLLAGFARLASEATWMVTNAWATNRAGDSGAVPPAGFRRRARIKR